MYIANHKYQNGEVIITDSNWYIKIRMDLDDLRHNNEFLIIHKKDFKNHLINLKIGWNNTVENLKNWLDGLNLKLDEIEVDDDDEKYIFEFIGEQEEIIFDYEDGLRIHLDLNSVTLEDYKIYKNIQEFMPMYEDYYFNDVIKLYYKVNNQYGSFLINNFFMFSNFIKTIETLSEFAEESIYLVNQIKEQEKLYFKDYIHYSNEIKFLYFNEYKNFNEKIIPFKKIKRKIQVSNEHGSTKY